MEARRFLVLTAIKLQENKNMSLVDLVITSFGHYHESLTTETFS